jgi:hypothetical protein
VSTPDGARQRYSGPCGTCGHPYSPRHDAEAPGPTSRHPFAVVHLRPCSPQVAADWAAQVAAADEIVAEANRVWLAAVDDDMRMSVVDGDGRVSSINHSDGAGCSCRPWRFGGLLVHRDPTVAPGTARIEPVPTPPAETVYASIAELRAALDHPG